jgi:hypothetical protein
MSSGTISSTRRSCRTTPLEGNAARARNLSAVPSLLPFLLLSASLFFPSVSGSLVDVVSSGETDSDYPQHEPIRISSDAELALPDDISGNGVRSGTGTEENPYRIKEWTIQPGDNPAVAISGTTSHVVVSELRIVPPPQEEVPPKAFVLTSTTNLTIENLEVIGWSGPTFAASGGDAELENVTIRGDALGPTIKASNTHLQLREIEISRVDTGVELDGSRISIEDSTFHDLGVGIHVPLNQTEGGTPGSLTVADSQFLGGSDPHHGLSMLSSYEGLPGGTTLQRNTIHGWMEGLRIDVTADANRTESLNYIVEKNRFTNNTFAIDHEGPTRNTDQVSINGNLLISNRWGIEGARTASIANNTFYANRIGVELSPSDQNKTPRIKGNTFEGSQDFGLKAPPSIDRVDAPNNWWGHHEGPTQGWSADGDDGPRDKVTPNVDPTPVKTERVGPPLPANVDQPDDAPIGLWVLFSALGIAFGLSSQRPGRAR